jgi:hypothetical protein
MTSTTIDDSTSSGESTTDFALPEDFRSLAAMKTATEHKMVELQTTRAVALKSKWADEAASLGLTPEEILHGVSKKKPRGRRAKRDE